MEQEVRFDDSALQGKNIITGKDIIALLPEEIKGQIDETYVYVDFGQCIWLLFLKESNGAYKYLPFSGEANYSPYARKLNYGRIWLWRKSRYLRTTSNTKTESKKTYTVFLCRPTFMFLWREVREYLVTEEGEGDVWSARNTKWFRAF